MQAFAKRFELIETFIALGDEELIPSFLDKLPASDDAQIVAIVAALHAEQYAQAMSLIEQFLSQYSGLVVLEDGIKAGLKLELKCLESKLLQLNEEKNSIQQLLSEFHRQYHLVLGSEIRAIQELRHQIAEETIRQSHQAYQDCQFAKAEKAATIEALKAQIKVLQNSSLNDTQIDLLHNALDELRNEKDQHRTLEQYLLELEEALKIYQAGYEQAKQNKAEFEQEVQHIIEQQVQELPVESKALLKKAYRQAAKLCHPDTVTEQYKEQAHHMMSELNLAYEQQDLTEVERILLVLESGTGFVVSSDGLNDNQQLQQKIAELRQHVAQLQAEIDLFMQDQSYQSLSTADALNAYFDSARASLEQHRQSLEAQYQQILSGA